MSRDILEKGRIELVRSPSGKVRRKGLECFRSSNEHFRKLLERRRGQFETMMAELEQKRRQSALWGRAFPASGLAKMYGLEMRFYRKGMRLYRKNLRRYTQQVSRFRGRTAKRAKRTALNGAALGFPCQKQAHSAQNGKLAARSRRRRDDSEEIVGQRLSL